MRRASRMVELEDILSSNFFNDHNDLINPILKGHLALEAILVDLIKNFEASDKIWGWSFPAKTKFLLDKNMLSSSQKEAYDEFNNLRNDFAHIFGHEMTLKIILDLAKSLEAKGIDFSDSAGQYSEEQASEYYDGIEGVLAEVIWCVLFDAAHTLSQNGGRDLFSDDYN